MLTDNGELHVHIEYSYAVVPGYKSFLDCEFGIDLVPMCSLFQSSSKSSTLTINEPFSTGVSVELRMEPALSTMSHSWSDPATSPTMICP